MSDNDADDTVAFDMVNTFVFRPDLTMGLTGNEIVTIPHLLIMVSASESFFYSVSMRHKKNIKFIHMTKVLKALS